MKTIMIVCLMIVSVTVLANSGEILGSKVTTQTASYSTVFSSSSLNIFNNGGFYTWGKFTTSDNQSTVSGSSITYTVAFSTNGANTWTTPQTIVNGTLLNSNTPYKWLTDEIRTRRQDIQYMKKRIEDKTKEVNILETLLKSNRWKKNLN